MSYMKCIPLHLGILLFAMNPACESKKSERVGAVETGGPKGAEVESEDEDKSKDSSDKEVDFETFSNKIIEDCKSSVTLYTPDKVFTGFNGAGDFQSPVWISFDCEVDIDYDEAFDAYSEEQMDTLFAELDKITALTGEVQVSIGNAAALEHDEAASIAEDGWFGAFFRSTAAGESTVTFTSGGETATTTFVITEYQAADVTSGQAIYDGTTAVDGVTACATCHASANGVDHSQNLISVCSDAELVGAITEGEYGNDAQGAEGICTGYRLSVSHSWTLDAAQLRQITAYLRTLPLDRPEGAEEQNAE